MVQVLEGNEGGWMTTLKDGTQKKKRFNKEKIAEEVVKAFKEIDTFHEWIEDVPEEPMQESAMPQQPMQEQAPESPPEQPMPEAAPAPAMNDPAAMLAALTHQYQTTNDPAVLDQIKQIVTQNPQLDAALAQVAPNIAQQLQGTGIGQGIRSDILA